MPRKVTKKAKAKAASTFKPADAVMDETPFAFHVKQAMDAAGEEARASGASPDEILRRRDQARVVVTGEKA